MRLGQLSRKINIKTSDIIEYLSGAHSVDVTNHPNAKIPEEYLDFIEKHFGVSLIEQESEVIVEASNTNEQKVFVEPESPEAIEADLTTEDTEGASNAANQDDLASSDEIDTPDLLIVDGVIKAPKIELSGPKVVGKIELPEPKKEDVNPEDAITDTDESNTNSVEINSSETSDSKSSRQTKPRKDKSRQANRSKKDRLPALTPEEERRIQLKTAQQQKIDAKKSQKAKRRERHLETSKAKQKSAQKSKLEKKTSNNRPKKTKQEAPKSLWGKFIYWLNN